MILDLRLNVDLVLEADDSISVGAASVLMRPIDAG